MSTAYQRINEAWNSSDPRGELNRVVEQLAGSASLHELDAALGQLLDEVRVAGADDETEEIINEVGDRLHGWCHESSSIRTTRHALPNEEEIARLPRWARVAFAARCARRVLPLFRYRWPNAPLLFDNKLDAAVELSELSAALAGQGGGVADFARAGTLAAYVCDAVINAVRDHSRAAEVVHATTQVFSKLQDVSPHIFEALIPLVAHNASVALSNGIATNHETYIYASRIADTVIRRDFDLLSRSARERNWTDETAVDQSWFGPMWPDGLPQGWPVYLDAVNEQSQHSKSLDGGTTPAAETELINHVPR